MISCCQVNDTVVSSGKENCYFLKVPSPNVCAISREPSLKYTGSLLAVALIRSNPQTSFREGERKKDSEREIKAKDLYQKQI